MGAAYVWVEWVCVQKLWLAFKQQASTVSLNKTQNYNGFGNQSSVTHAGNQFANVNKKKQGSNKKWHKDNYTIDLGGCDIENKISKNWDNDDFCSELWSYSRGKIRVRFTWWYMCCQSNNNNLNLKVHCNSAGLDGSFGCTWAIRIIYLG